MGETAGDSLLPWFTHRRMVPKWLGLGAFGALALTAPALSMLWLVPLGLLIFFPLEYITHRWVYHGFAGTTPGKVVSKQHVLHHDRPQELDHLFNDPRFGVLVSFVLFGVYYWVSGAVATAAAVTAGNYSGFVYYEWVHFNSHRPHARPSTPWGRALKRNHMLHHFKHERYWYGVTTSVFDHTFRSFKRRDEVATSPTVRTLLPPVELVAWMSGDPRRTSSGSHDDTDGAMRSATDRFSDVS